MQQPHSLLWQATLILSWSMRSRSCTSQKVYRIVGFHMHLSHSFGIQWSVEFCHLQSKIITTAMLKFGGHYEDIVANITAHACKLATKYDIILPKNTIEAGQQSKCMVQSIWEKPNLCNSISRSNKNILLFSAIRCKITKAWSQGEKIGYSGTKYIWRNTLSKARYWYKGDWIAYDKDCRSNPIFYLNSKGILKKLSS